jgi:hypothetical protein
MTATGHLANNRRAPTRAGRSLAGALAGVLALVLSSGCAMLHTASLVDRDSAPPPVVACADWYAELDAQIEQAGVRDASAARIAGFPHLRVDRFTASLKDTLPPQAGSTDAMAAFMQRLQRLDADARLAEVANLPPGVLARLAGSATPQQHRAQVLQKTQDCAQQLSAYHLASAEHTTSLLARLAVPDDYNTSYRLLGAYALTRYPFASGVRQLEAQRSAVFASRAATLLRAGAPASDLAPDPSAAGGGNTDSRTTQRSTTYLRLSPPTPLPSSALSAGQISGMLAAAQANPLRVPAPTPEQAQQLLAHFAPSFHLGIQSSDDQPGALVWQPGHAQDAPDTLEVDTKVPVVYSQVAHTRYGAHSLLQLVYTLWFPARPMAPGSRIDLLAGKLDGITWRVTLAPDGTPLVYDTMHPCGCYHMFFPTPAARAKPAPQPGIEWAFVPQALPHLTAGQQVVVHVAAGTHYIDYVGVERMASGGAGGAASLGAAPNPTPSSAPLHASVKEVQYAWRSYDGLRSLPTAAGGAADASKPTHRSIFGPDGFVAHTDRAERFIFWPMGIPRAGAMRQWGKHATAFVGRRHFDDATLMEQRFEFDRKHFAAEK